MRGKTAACTPDAWSATIARPPVAGNTRRPPILRTIDDELEAALGIETNANRR